MSTDPNDPEKLLVRYKNERFDLTTFIHKHPGGKNTLNLAYNSDIDNKFDKIVPHSNAAKYLINEYKVPNGVNNNDDSFGNISAMKIEAKSYDDTNSNQFIDNSIKIDESMEVINQSKK